jgi:signal transduction histidine kinase
MPDGAATDEPLADAGSTPASADDARLIRNVRWRLVAWSGLTTLLVLVVLAAALYVSVAKTLESSGVAQLDSRLDALRGFTQHPPNDPEAPATGFTFGGGSSGTFAILVSPSGDAIGPREFRLPTGLPVAASVDGARTSGRDVRTATVATVPIRVLTVPLVRPEGTFYIQVVQDRTAEVRTLDTVVLVLGVGGLIVVLVAFGFGAIYARRALVPIRESLTAQRTALRRQREFAADASHELRTPLTVIRSSVEHLRRHPDRPVASVGDALDDIGAEVEHLTTLVDDLLLLARSDSGAITLDRLPLELDDVAVIAASSLDPLASSRGVRLAVDPEPAPVVGDPTRLRQLVTILVDNAIRHSPRDGEVSIRVRTEGSTARLEVDDRGPGIRPEDMPHVFDRFWRAPGAPSGGTGLGLAIAKWIVEHHEGTIDVSNRPEGGARFAVRLPARPAAPAASSAELPRLEEGRG